jgi:hypothetical protein
MKTNTKKINTLNYADIVRTQSVSKIKSVLEDVEKDIRSIYESSGAMSGNQYIMVPASGSDIENGESLLQAYETAKSMNPSASNRITIIAYPGNYGLSQPLVMDTSYIDLVSLTGNMDLVFDRLDLEDPFVDSGPPSFNIIEIGEVVEVTANNVFLKGVVGKKRISDNYLSYYGITKVYFLPIIIEENLPSTIIEKCFGGSFSFGTDKTGQFDAKVISSTFVDCIANGVEVFGTFCILSGTFIGCKSTATEDSEFGFQNFSFCYGMPSTGYFKDCSTEYRNSFGRDSEGTYINCVGAEDSFRNANGLFLYCRSTHPDSFAGVRGNLYFCKSKGTYSVADVETAVVQLCVDGNNNVTNIKPE